jgi:hypothetical protein
VPSAPLLHRAARSNTRRFAKLRRPPSSSRSPHARHCRVPVGRRLSRACRPSCAPPRLDSPRAPPVAAILCITSAPLGPLRRLIRRRASGGVELTQIRPLSHGPSCSLASPHRVQPDSCSSSLVDPGRPSTGVTLGQYWSPGANVVTGKCIFKHKLKADDSLDWYKACWVL